MRIVSGKHKSLRITAPKKLPVRPTTDMAKEGLFNILNNSYYFEDLTILDLFAGTGNISYEFASRGTSEIIAVDANHGCIKFINKTSEELQMDISTIKSDVFKYLERQKGKFDIIFADPPYDLPFEDFCKIVALVFANNMLAEDGQLIIEHFKQTNLSEQEHFTKLKKYGSSAFSFFNATASEN
ncbi:MAG: 16S rRNA (guanine(966)-N(2))-methyltransferase RsmD [Flavobacteriaceae bacterium]|nr:MAG: 16S rRNA (guanine(966)-N(2))-methyltransferase RsmD [Flavobacteriaceae bacterium]